MKVLVSAADTASVKEVAFSRFVDTTNKESDAPNMDVLLPSAGNGPKKSLAVTHIAVQESSKSVAVVRKNGVVQLGETELTRLDDAGQCVGLFWGPDDSEFSGTLLVFGSDGDCKALNTANKKVLPFKLRSGLSSVVQDPETPLVFASAGTDPLPDVFKLNITKDFVDVEMMWQAVQPPNNRLDLPEENLVTCLAFADSNTLVSATSNGRMRVYDLLNSDPDAVDKPGQPIEMSQVSKFGIKSLVADPTRPNTVILGDSRTTVSRWALKPSKLLGHYKGVSGSTRALSTRGKFVALGGLDRYVRVYDIEKRQPAGKVYIGEEIWSLVLIKQDEEEDIDDVDTLWNDLGLSKRGAPNESPAKKRTKVTDTPESSDKMNASKPTSETSESESEPESESDAESESGSEVESESEEESASDVSENGEGSNDSEDSFYGFD